MSAETPYAIGVIRARERTLFGNDEYTRLVDAPTTKEALHVLRETAYGEWLEHDARAEDMLAALSNRLSATQRWLTEATDVSWLLPYMQVRYDVLNITSALLAHQQNAIDGESFSPLGRFAPERVQLLVSQGAGVDDIEDTTWREYVRAELANVPTTDAAADEVQTWRSGLMTRAEAFAADQLSKLAASPLSRWHANYLAERSQALQAASDPTEAEREWDNTLIAKVKTYRSDPVGADAILAFWLALELEVKTIRVLLSLKLFGLNSQDLTTHRRELYRV